MGWACWRVVTSCSCRSQRGWISRPKDQPPLARISPDKTLDNGQNKYSADYWRNNSARDILDSVKLGLRDSLKVKSDSRIFDGNTKIRILQERGNNVNTLLRPIVP